MRELKNEIDLSTFGGRLTFALNNAKDRAQEMGVKLTNRAIAQKLGVTEITIYNYLNNLRTPKARYTYEVLAKILDVPPQFLIWGN